MGRRRCHSRRPGLAARRGRDVFGSDPAALAVGQSAILRRVACCRCGGLVVVCARSVEFRLAGVRGLHLESGEALSMNAINQSILTWILLVPLAGAVLV